MKRAIVAFFLVWVFTGSAAFCLDLSMNPIANGGFEQLEAGRALPPPWEFHIVGGAAAAASVDEKVFHRGRRCIRLRSGSAAAPDVYGRLTQKVKVLPGVGYVLSAWVKGEKVLGGQQFTDWKSYTLRLPSGTFDWRLALRRFVTRPDQTELEIGLNIANRAEGLWVDDVRLELDLAWMKPLRPNVRLGFWAPDRIEGDDAPFKVFAAGFLPPEVEEGARVELEANGASIAASDFAGSGTALGGSARSLPKGRVAFRFTVRDGSGAAIASGEKEVEVVSESRLLEKLDQLQAGLARLRRQIEQAERKGIAADYPRISATILENFIPWTREDIQTGELTRADYAVKDMEASLARAEAEIEKYEKTAALPGVARYRTSPVEIQGTHFVADVERAGKVKREPVFFIGYGHFGQVRQDIEKFPSYGTNIIQIEFGPSRVVGENAISFDDVERDLKVMDRAAANNVAVNLLLSPHYFPGWAMQKWPDLGKCGGGFIKYCIDAPEAKMVLEKFLRAVIPKLRDHPALHSLCLSNEPIYRESRDCEYTRQKWIGYLRRMHGSLAKMNARFKTSYSSFDEVPIPANDEFAAPQFYDWCVFNQQRFAEWHKWMADIIHEMWPEARVHAKIMPIIFDRNAIASGVDPELFSALSQINGDDCWIGYPGRDEWANNWHTQNMLYDLQRSMKQAPVFNSENHPTSDRSTHYYPPEHFRMVLWQGAVHGLGATTIWVWERTRDRTSDIYGNVMHRPGCAEETGRTCLDLLRLNDEVVAVQNSAAAVAILYSVASIAGCEEYMALLQTAYEALDFCGARIDFVSETQAPRKLGSYRLIIVPGAARVKEKTFEALERFVRNGGKLFFLGENNLAFDEYGQARDRKRVAALAKASVVDKKGPQLRRLLFDALRKAGAAPPVTVLDENGKELSWGVEWLTAERKGRLLLNTVNLTKEPARVVIRCGAEYVQSAFDLVSGNELPKKSTGSVKPGTRTVFALQPLVPVLLDLGPTRTSAGAAARKR
jgi:hypothetical protein